MPGGALGLQNQCGAEKVPGGFDSHSPPPFSTGKRTMSLALRNKVFSRRAIFPWLLVTGAIAVLF